MKISTLRREISLREAKEETVFTTTHYCYYKNNHDHHNLCLTYNPNLNQAGLLRLLIEDYQNGFLKAYNNPTLVTNFQDFNYAKSLRMINEENPQQFLEKLIQLYDKIKDDNILHFGLGENWERGDGNYDTLLRIINPNESFISATPRTKTRHLTPFIDARVNHGSLIIYENGKEVVIERLQK